MARTGRETPRPLLPMHEYPDLHPSADGQLLFQLRMSIDRIADIANRLYDEFRPVEMHIVPAVGRDHSAAVPRQMQQIGVMFDVLSRSSMAACSPVTIPEWAGIRH